MKKIVTLVVMVGLLCFGLLIPPREVGAVTEDAILPDEPPLDVWLDVSVTGQGRIQSTNTGLNLPIDCGDGHSRCGGDYGYGLTINLRAVPAAGHHFVRWEGDCSDTGPECSVDMVHEDKIVDAVFAADGPPPPPPRPNLRVLSVNMDCPTPASPGCADWRLDMMGQAIASAAPDILLVRELFWAESANILVNAVRSHGHPLNYVEARPGGGDASTVGAAR